MKNYQRTSITRDQYDKQLAVLCDAVADAFSDTKLITLDWDACVTLSEQLLDTFIEDNEMEVL